MLTLPLCKIEAKNRLTQTYLHMFLMKHQAGWGKLMKKRYICNNLRYVFLLSAAAMPALSTAALAQQGGTLYSAPERATFDENNVDLQTGQLIFSTTDLTIGNTRGLSYSRSWQHNAWRSDLASITRNDDGSLTVNLGVESLKFTSDGNGTYTNAKGDGATMEETGGLAIVTSREGARYTFQPTAHIPYRSSFRLLGIDFPDGEKLAVNWFDYQVPCEPDCFPPTFLTRPTSIESNLGYIIKFDYWIDTVADDNNNAEVEDFLYPVTAVAVNRANEHVDPASTDIASISANWPRAQYSGYENSGYTATLPDGMKVRYGVDSQNRITTMRRADDTATTVNISYNSDNRVANISGPKGAWTYTYADAGDVRTVTVTNALGAATIHKFSISKKQRISVTDPAGNTTGFTYDAKGRVTKTTLPEGNAQVLTYDARGNIRQVSQKAKPGSPLADIVIKAGYASSCTNNNACNKPLWTRDARGNQTDYTYDPATALVTNVKLPAPAPGEPRPEIQYSYITQQARYRKNSASVVASGEPVTLLSRTSTCNTAATCPGSADELVTEYGYGAGSAANNLDVRDVTARTGDASLVATTQYGYDDIGNLITTDGPLASTADTVRTRYDAARRPVGVIGPDPDGSGNILHSAVRTTYDTLGRASKVEVGTVTSQSDSAWNAMSVNERTEITYDAADRPIKTESFAGSPKIAVQQNSYDTVGRLECSTTRMNPATFSSLPSSACTLGAAGTAGPDRITKNFYDANDRVIKVQEGVGTTAQSDTANITYSANGQVKTLTDGNGNKT